MKKSCKLPNIYSLDGWAEKVTQAEKDCTNYALQE